MDLSEEQLLFLFLQNVPLSRTFDASGMAKTDYEHVMARERLWIAYGVAPCKASGHTLRTRKGHCVQCDTARIAYMRRNDDGGEVYLAFSPSDSLCKVGTARDAAERVDVLSATGYGGCSDWCLVESFELDSGAGAAEFRIQRTLSPFKASRSYWREGRLVSCDELFACDAETALLAIREVC